MYDDEWIEKEGLSPEKAFELVCDRHPDLDEYKELESTNDSPEEIVARRAFLDSAFMSPDFRPKIARSDRSQRFLDIKDDFWNSFIQQLMKDELIAFGRRDSRLDSYMRIPAAAWPDLDLSCRNSTAKELRKKGSTLFDIRVFEKHLAPQELDVGSTVEKTPKMDLDKTTFRDVWDDLEEKFPDEFEKFYNGKLVDTEFSRFLHEKCGGIYTASYFRREFGIMRKIRREKT